MTRLLWLIVVALLVAGCSSWSGPAEVRLKNGTTIACPKGLAFDPVEACARIDAALARMWASVMPA